MSSVAAPAIAGLQWLWQWLLLPWRKLHELLMYIPTVAAARRLKELEEAAEAAPDDPRAQRAFLMELNVKHPEQVLEHMQSGKYATDSLVVKEYMKVPIPPPLPPPPASSFVSCCCLLHVVQRNL